MYRLKVIIQMVSDDDKVEKSKTYASGLTWSDGTTTGITYELAERCFYLVCRELLAATKKMWPGVRET